MRFISATVFGFVLMIGSANANHHFETKTTPVRSAVSGVVDAQPVRSAVARVKAVRPLQRLLDRIRRCC